MPTAPRTTRKRAAEATKSHPDLDSRVAACVAALEQEKAIARSAVGPASIREEVLRRLKSRGYEVTAKGVRVPLLQQLESALVDGSYIATKSLQAHTCGATLAEARKAARSLAEAGRACLVMRTDSETLVPAGADVVAEKELAGVARRATELAKLLQRVAGKRKGVGVLRKDLQAGLDAVCAAPQPNGSPRAFPSVDTFPRVLRAVEAARDDSTGLSFVPNVVARLAPELDTEAAKRALVAAASQGLLELRPEGGLGRLSDAERHACPEGPQGTRLSWTRRIEVRG